MKPRTWRFIGVLVSLLVANFAIWFVPVEPARGWLIVVSLSIVIFLTIRNLVLPG